jgi:hypothetical protein
MREYFGTSSDAVTTATASEGESGMVVPLFVIVAVGGVAVAIGAHDV